ncbi:MAG: acylphosphatase [Myxococcota bacterium]
MVQRRTQMHVVVKGQVQGVGYRFSTQQQAKRWGLLGWVRNAADGGVEAVFQGPEDVVASMVVWCERGPLHASVESVLATRQALEAFQGFDVRH